MATLLFPLNERKVKWSSTVEEEWDVTEQTSASGKSRTLVNQDLPLWIFSIEFPRLSAEEKDTLFAFFARVKASAIPFFYKDAENYKCENARLPQNTDGSYQLVANMHGYQEAVEYADHLTVYVDGAQKGEQEYTIDRGAIKFNTQPSAGAKVTATYHYWWKVRFEKKKLQIKQKFDDFFECSLSLKVVR